MLRFFVAVGSITIVVLLSALNSYAQTATLKGVVRDAANGQTVAGATVYLSDLKLGTATDTAGVFILEKLPTGTFIVQVEEVGYAAFTQRIALKNGDNTLEVRLGGTVAEIHEVVITGTSEATEIHRNPVPTAVLGKAELRGVSATNAVAAVATLPGVSMLSTGGAIGKPIIRGLGYNRVVTLNNGFRQEGQQWGDEHGIEIDEYSVDRVEVVKGPGSLLYGSDAMAGVVNFLPDRLPSVGVQHGEATAEYQTNSGLAGASLMGEGNSGGFVWRLRGSYQRSASFQNPYDGRVFNTGSELLAGNTTLGVQRKWGHSYLHASTFNQQIGFCEGTRDSTGAFTTTDNGHERAATADELRSYNIRLPFQRVGHHRIASENLFLFGEHRLAVNVAFQQNTRREFSANKDTAGLNFRLNTFNLDAKYTMPLGEWSLTFGASGMQQRSDNLGTEFLIPAYSLLDGGVFAVTKRTFGKLDLSGGLRYDARHITTDALTEDGVQRFAPVDAAFANWSGSAGVAYRFSEAVIAKLNVARGFRAPTTAELASNGQHDGTFRYEIGNPALKAESSTQGDLGLDVHTAHVSFEAAIFYNAIANFIHAERLGDSMVAGTPVYRFASSGVAALYGGEAGVDIHPHPLDWLHFKNTLSYVSGQNLAATADSTRYLPSVPPLRFTSELRADITHLSTHFTATNVALHFEYDAAQTQVLTANHTETASVAYSLWGLSATTTVLGRGQKPLCTVYLIGSNLLDTAYQAHLSRLRYAPENTATGRIGIWNAGRNVTLKLTVPIGK